MFRSFLFDRPQGAICRALHRYRNVFRWFVSSNIYMVCGCMRISSICVCVCVRARARVRVLGALVSGRSVCDLLSSLSWVNLSSQTDLPLTRAPSTHTNRWYTHTATYHVNIQRTQISGRHYSNGVWPPEDGRIKRTETCRGFLCLQTCF